MIHHTVPEKRMKTSILQGTRPERTECSGGSFLSISTLLKLAWEVRHDVGFVTMALGSLNEEWTSFRLGKQSDKGLRATGRRKEGKGHCKMSLTGRKGGRWPEPLLNVCPAMRRPQRNVGTSLPQWSLGDVCDEWQQRWTAPGKGKNVEAGLGGKVIEIVNTWEVGILLTPRRYPRARQWDRHWIRSDPIPALAVWPGAGWITLLGSSYCIFKNGDSHTDRTSL